MDTEEWKKHFLKEKPVNVEAQKAAEDWENLQRYIKENVRPSDRLPADRFVTVERTFDRNIRLLQLQEWPVTPPFNYKAKNFFWETGTVKPPRTHVWSRHLLIWGGFWLFAYWTYFRYSGTERANRRWIIFDKDYDWPPSNPRSEWSERH